MCSAARKEREKHPGQDLIQPWKAGQRLWDMAHGKVNYTAGVGRQRMCTAFKSWPQPAAEAAKNPCPFWFRIKGFSPHLFFCPSCSAPLPLSTSTEVSAAHWGAVRRADALQTPSVSLETLPKISPWNAPNFSLPATNFAGGEREGWWCHRHRLENLQFQKFHVPLHHIY